MYDYEPLTKEDELRFIEPSVLTPHIAYKTEEALERKASVTIDNVVRGIKGNKINRVI